MPIYASSFTTGFEPLVKECLPALLKGVQMYDIYNGLVVYRYDGRPENVKRLKLFANTFLVLMRMSNTSFRSMLSAAPSKALTDYTRYVRPNQSFRVRFHKNGSFEHVEPGLVSQAEQLINKRTRMRTNKVKPDWEFWYILRTENIGIYAMLLYKREQTEKTLPQGALRPELAQCMCLFAQINGTNTVLDPFAGHGSIPEQLLGMRCGRVITGDKEADSVKQLRRKLNPKPDESESAAHTARKQPNAPVAEIYKWDARDMAIIENESIDRIITDPPWGIFSNEYTDIAAFYNDVMNEFMRVLRPGGSATILSAAKSEIRHAAHDAGFSEAARLDILVNGKKAGLFRFVKPRVRKTSKPNE